MLSITHLQSGGLITNYFCTSRCRHCLYCCSPFWPHHYVERETALRILRKIQSLGCYSVHIGGGEPMLNISGLRDVLDAASEVGMDVEYVETNSSWFKDDESAISILRDLKSHGLDTILVSISPFHNENVPLYKVKGVIRACNTVGIGVFPWVMDFLQDLEAIGDESKTHKLEEYSEKFGDEYVKGILRRYWIHFGGRSLDLFRPFFPLKSAEQLCSESGGGSCSKQLSDTSHFHIDLKGNYVPGLCSGLSIDMEDLGKPLSSLRYPILTTLYTSGVKGLMNYAKENYGIGDEEISQKKFFHKCELCSHLRRLITIRSRTSSLSSQSCLELQPSSLYDNF